VQLRDVSKRPDAAYGAAGRSTIITEVRPLEALSVEAEWLVVGDYFVDASNQHRYPGHEVLNLRAAWDFAPRWRAMLRVNNALDRRYADRADFAFGEYRYFPGRPRSVFVEVSWRTD
jgi:iron complex outermembrane receptor protein